ncbi:MAG: dihydrofolate reductase family protein [Candidatus Aenigmarchaeota archaeon]|nr:dihydrofolate reductase family protein [Candidatus Aenigmarchaeota archaeon]
MHVIVNCAMSLDGRIEGKFSNDKDWKRVYELRAECDAVMVGINTILKDNSGLTSHGVGKNPLIVVVDSKCRIPSDARVFEGNVVVGVCEGVKTDAVWNKAKVIACGKKQVDLKVLVEELALMGVEKLMVEGGGMLIASMLDLGLVDQVNVAVAPVILGRGIKLVEDELKLPVNLKLKDILELDEIVVLEYVVLK